MTLVKTPQVTVPAIGFGTWELEDAYDNVRYALEAGYRHVDTAQIYHNEDDVGRAIADSEVDRDDVFVTTKVWRREARAEDVVRSTHASLERLRTDRVDLLLLHWPADHIAPLQETLEAMLAMHQRGLVRHLGVSNFPAAELERALGLAPIVMDQVEHHPYLAIDAIREVAHRGDVAITAYCPLARGALIDDPVLTEVAEARDATVAQVSLAWLLAQPDTVVIPKSATPARIAENLAARDLVLSDAEVARIGTLARGHREVDPPWGPDWDV